MKTSLCLLVLTLLIAASQGESLRESLKMYSSECESVSGISGKLILARILNNEDLQDVKLAEHGVCILKKAGFMNESGDVLTDNVKSKLKNYSEHPENVDAFVDKCAVKKDSPQGTAAHLVVCLLEERTQ